MLTFFKRFFEIVVRPDTFFERACKERDWRAPRMHLAILTLWLSLGSVIAWGFGIPGDTPINSSHLRPKEIERCFFICGFSRAFGEKHCSISS